MTERLPTPGSDNNTWGGILNDFLLVEHGDDGTHGGYATPKSHLPLNVRDYCTPSDTADNTAALQACLDAAATHGVTVDLAGGHYGVTGLIGSSGLRIIGSGGQTTNPSSEPTLAESFGAILFPLTTDIIMLDFDGGATLHQQGPVIEDVGFHLNSQANVVALRLRNYNRLRAKFCTFRGGVAGSRAIQFDANVAPNDSSWHDLFGLTIKEMDRCIDFIESYGCNVFGGDFTPLKDGYGVYALGKVTAVNMFGTKIQQGSGGEGTGRGIYWEGGLSTFEGMALEGLSVDIADDGTTLGSGDNNKVSFHLSASPHGLTIGAGCRDNYGLITHQSTTTPLTDGGSHNRIAVSSRPVYFPDALATRVKAGVPTDADYPVAPPDGTIEGDSTHDLFYMRLGGVWKPFGSLSGGPMTGTLATTDLALSHSKCFVEYTPKTTTSMNINGTGNYTVSGTLSTISPDTTSASAFGPMTNIVGAASAAAITNLVNGAPLLVDRSPASAVFAGWFAHSRVIYPDASYEETGASTGTRLWGMGFYNGTGGTFWGADRGGSQDVAGFSRCSVNGGAQDTNWQFVTNDGGAVPTVADTGMPFVVAHVYDFYTWSPAGATAIYWQVDDVTAGTTFSGSVATDLPREHRALVCVIGCSSVDATARNVQIGRLYIEADNG